MIGIITGSGIYELKEVTDPLEHIIETPYGNAEVTTGNFAGKQVAFLARHGKNHELLPNMINYRANLFAFKTLGVKAIIASSVMGVVDPAIELGKVLFFDDMFFLDNRLPDGSICTLFNRKGETGRGHYIFSSPYSSYIGELATEAAGLLGIEYVNDAIYAHVNGPRFNSKVEIRFLQSAGVTAISQTAGPEAILAGEAGIAYYLLGFGIDYANGVTKEPTPVEVLNQNLSLGAEVVPELLKAITAAIDEEKVSTDGFVYEIE